MKKIGFLFATVIMLLMFAVSASAATEGYYTYEVANGEATITDVDEAISGDVTIPSNIGGYRVTSIGRDAFNWCTNLTSITIQDSVISIGDNAFSGCQKLTTITIPYSVTYIGSYVFSLCRALTSIRVDKNNTFYCSVDGVLFNKDKTMLVKYPSGNTRTSYIIPDSVKQLSSSAIFDCQHLEKIVLGENFYMGNYGPSYLRYPYLDISDCPNLKSVIVNEKNQYFASDDNGIVFNKDKTVIIYYPEGKVDAFYEIPYSVIMVGINAFSSNKYLESIILGENIKYIDEYAFGGSCLKHVYINRNIEYIGIGAFWATEKLENIEVSPENKYYCSINGVLFNKAKDNLIMYPSQKSDNTYCVPEGVEKILCRSFDYAEHLEKLYIPATVNEIYYSPKSSLVMNGAIECCDNLKEIIVDDNNVEYCSLDGVLYNKDKSVLIKFPDNKKIDVFTIPNSVKKIANYAFFVSRSWLIDRGSIVIPDTVEEMQFSCVIFDHICYMGSKEKWDTMVSYSESKYLHCEFASDADIKNSFKNPTCQNEGFKSVDCSCGYIYSIEALSKVKCSFTDYKVDDNATCLTDGTKTAYCDYGCGKKSEITIEGSAKGHSYSTIIIESKCMQNGYTVYTCNCGYNYTETIEPTGHTFDGSKCTNCDYDKSDDCNCNCHKGGIAGFFFKIILFFQKIFRTNKTCSCGVAHY